MKKIIIVIVAIIFILLSYSIYKSHSNKNDFEQKVIDKIIEDDQIGKTYKLEDFLTPEKYDYIDFKYGFDIEGSNGFEKIVFIKNGKKVKVFYTKMDSIGDLQKKQLFLSTDDVKSVYRCKPNATIQVVKINHDSEFYDIKPLNCSKY